MSNETHSTISGGPNEDAWKEFRVVGEKINAKYFQSVFI